MYAMQYEIPLPADYDMDMDVIRRRVATRGASTDAQPGLGFKTYAIRERGVDGSSVHQYAPFYLWASTAGVTEFLLGTGFAAPRRRRRHGSHGFEVTRRRPLAPHPPPPVDIAVQCGNADQPHLAREWQALTGCTIGMWLRDGLPFVQGQTAMEPSASLV